MGFKIVRLQAIYSKKYIEKIYFENKSLQNESYQRQNTFFMNLVMDMPAKAFVEDFRKFGNKAEVIFWNNPISQKKWAEENNFVPEKNYSNSEIILAQLKKIKPDVVLFINTASLPSDIRVNIKKIIPSIKLSVINEDFPGAYQDFSDADILIVNTPILQKRYSYLKPYLIYHSFDPSILSKLKENKKDREYNLGFLGSLRFPESRYYFIKNLYDKFNFYIWTNKKLKNKLFNKNKKKLSYKLFLIKLMFNFLIFRKAILFFNKLFKIKKINQAYNLYDLSKTKQRKIPETSQNEIKSENFEWLKSKKINSEKYGLDYYSVLKNTKIILNRHSDFASSTADNMKIFEITGMGACLITDSATNLNELFVPGKEVVTYSNFAEAEEKINFLLKNPKICSDIAEAGQKKTLSAHTSFHRNKKLNNIIVKHLT